jgi:transcriptional regulator with XRE-family HTH domain
MSISTTAPEVKEARTRYEWTQENVADELFLTRQMIQMVEKGKRRLNEQDTARLARKLDDGQFKLAMARRITGGLSAPYLNGIDNHRMACIMKLVEELQEAIDIITANMRLLIRAQSAQDLQPGEREQLEAMMLETIECITAAENTLARLARTYNISLADLWDRHEKELSEKGYLKKEKDRIAAAR